MKKKFTFLMAALMLLLTLFIQPGIVRGQDYKKVTSEPSDWSGEYLLVYENNTTASVFTGVNTANNFATTTITNGTITKPDGTVTITIASMTGGYSLQVNGGNNNGKYMKNASNNGMLFDSNPVANTLSISNHSAVITCNNKTIKYNTSWTGFRYYGSGQQVVQLYERLYTITISDDIENGSVVATIGNNGASSATSGTTITLTATPESEFDFVSFTVTDSDSGDVPVTTVNNTGTFVMPSKNVTVSATFESSGGGSTPSMSVSPTNIAYGDKAVGSSNNETFTITYANLTATSISLTGTNTTDCTISPSSVTVDESGSGSQVVTVTYAPQAAGTLYGSITVDDATDNLSETVTVTGTAKVPHNITIGAMTHGNVVADKSTAIEGETVTLTVTPATGYSIKTLTYTTGGDPVAIANNEFSMPASNVTINAEFEEKEDVTYDFSNIDGFSDWGTTYKEHVVTYDEATVTFASANHQTSTITNIPVTKGKDVEIVMKTGEPNMTGVKFVCRQWNTNAQTIKLYYSTNHGESYTTTNITSTNFTIEDKTLPAGTNAVKITFSSSSNQVGIESATLTFTADPTLSINPTLLTGFNYTVDNNDNPSDNKTFTVAGNYLEDDVTVELPSDSDFEITNTVENNNSWTNSLTLTQSSGALSSTTIYVRMKAGLEINDYSEDITITSGDLLETVSLSGTVDPAPVMTTYNLATSVTPGKHYIIVSTNTSDEYFAMGGQNGDYRDPISITVTSNSTTIASNAGISEVVISGNGTNGFTLHAADGYLAGGNKTLMNNGTITSTWTISISSNVATISAGGYSIKYNAQSPRFNCYGSGQRDVYLYEKEGETDYNFYSNTTINDPSISALNTMTVKKGAKLTLTGDVSSCSNASWLVVEDGGQLVIPSAKTDVKATFQKKITAYTIVGGKDHYYLIANPTTDVLGIDPDDVGMLDNNYDLYYFDESIPGIEWRNYKKVPFNLFNGKGYLYANSSSFTIEFPGTVLPGTTANITLSKSENGTYKGFNLVGNPLSNNITSMTIGGEGCNYYKLNSEGVFAVSTDPIIVGEAFMVEAQNDKDVLTINPAKKDEDGFTNEVIRLEVSNSKFTDVAYVYFGNHLPLTKINHLNDEAPMLYIHNENSDKAVEVYNNRGEVKSIKVNFEAKTIGTYTISAKMVKGEIKYMHLYDRFTGIDTDLLIDDYSFIGANKDQPGRFILKLEAIDNEFEGSDNFAYQSGNNIMVNGEGELQIFDIMGRMVMNQRINGVETINGINNGVYIFKLEGKTQKIVVR